MAATLLCISRMVTRPRRDATHRSGRWRCQHAPGPRRLAVAPCAGSASGGEDRAPGEGQRLRPYGPVASHTGRASASGSVGRVLAWEARDLPGHGLRGAHWAHETPRSPFSGSSDPPDAPTTAICTPDSQSEHGAVHLPVPAGAGPTAPGSLLACRARSQLPGRQGRRQMRQHRSHPMTSSASPGRPCSLRQYQHHRGRGIHRSGTPASSIRILPWRGPRAAWRPARP
jgi:hypothetical protein